MRIAKGSKGELFLHIVHLPDPMIFHRKAKDKKGASTSNNEEGNSSVVNKRTARQNVKPTRPVFNQPLSVAIDNMPSRDGLPIVELVRNCIDFVVDHGLKAEGIYRISASKNVLDDMEVSVNLGEPIHFEDAHEAANLLKRFLRGLPDHILTFRLKAEIEQITGRCICNSMEPCRCEVVSLLKQFLSKNLPAPNYYLLAYVFRHSQQVVLNSTHNKMSLSAIGVLLQAIMQLTKNGVRIFLLNASSILLNPGDEPIVELFTDIPFDRYNPKIEDDHVVNDNLVANEIFRQETILSNLNQQLNSVDKKSPEAKEKEHQIRKIQQQIVNLKKKLSAQATNLDNKDYDTQSNSSSSTNIQVGPLPPVFLEKQLLAVHISLQEDVSSQKKQVAQLLTRLRNIQNQLPPELLETFEKLPALPSPQSSPNNTELDVARLDSDKAKLLNEVTYYRDLCARLRSRFEQCTVLLNTVKQSKNNKELNAECLKVIAPASTDPEVEHGKGPLLVTRF